MKRERKAWEKLAKINPFRAAIAGTDKPATFSDFLFEIIPKYSSVLDVGCGYGRNAIPLTHLHKCDVVGLDFSRSMCKYTKEKGVEVVIGDLCHLPFRGGAFNYLISILTLQHLPSRSLEKALHEFSRTSSASIFDLPNFELYKLLIGRRVKANSLRKDLRSRRGARMSHYTFEELKRICGKFFRDVKIRGTGYVARIPRTRVRIKHPLRIKRFANKFICECSK